MASTTSGFNKATSNANSNHAGSFWRRSGFSNSTALSSQVSLWRLRYCRFSFVFGAPFVTVPSWACNQNISPPLLFFSLIRFQLRQGSLPKVAHQSRRFLCGRNQRVEIPTVPFGNSAISIDEMRFPQIEQQPFILRGNDFVTPMMRFCFMTNVASENNKRVAMITISRDNLENCVAADNQDRENQRDRTPSIDAGSRGLILCSHPP